MTPQTEYVKGWHQGRTSSATFWGAGASTWGGGVRGPGAQPKTPPSEKLRPPCVMAHMPWETYLSLNAKPIPPCLKKAWRWSFLPFYMPCRYTLLAWRRLGGSTGHRLSNAPRGLPNILYIPVDDQLLLNIYKPAVNLVPPCLKNQDRFPINKIIKTSL